VVPSAFFLGGRRPPFVLFDAHGGLLDPAAAPQVRISPGDGDALTAFLLEHGAAWMSDPAVSRPVRAWGLRRVLPGVAAALLVDERPPRLAVERMQRATGLLAMHALAGPRERADLCVLLEASDLRVARALDCTLWITALAAERGEADARVVSALAQAALLADLSLARMPRVTGVDPTAPDREAMQRHPALSQELARRMGVGSPVVHYAIAGHHERWDGRGYPNRLAEGRIPLEGRLLAAVDGVSQRARSAGDRDVVSRDTLTRVLAEAGRYDLDVLRLLVRMLAEVAIAHEQAQAQSPGDPRGGEPAARSA